VSLSYIRAYAEIAQGINDLALKVEVEPPAADIPEDGKREK
jgi:hypothetical protein